MDQQLDILIRTIADQHGAEEVSASLKRVTTATQDGSKASVKAHEEGGKAAQEHTGHIEGLHKATGFLTRQFGELGHIAHFAFSLPALAVAALAVGIHKVSEASDEWKKKIEEAALEIQQVNRAKIDGVTSATLSAKEEMAKLVTELANAGRQADELKTRFDKMRAAFKAASIEESEADRKELAERERKQEGYELLAIAARKRASEVDEDENYQAALKVLEVEKAKTELFEKDVRLHQQERENLHAGYLAGDDSSAGRRLELNKEVEDLQKNQSEIALAQAIILQHNLDKSSADTAAGRANGQATANAGRISELTAKAGVERSTGYGGDATTHLGLAESISGRVAAGGTATGAEQSFVRQVASIATGQSVDFPTAVRALEYEKTHRETNTKFLERIITALEKSGSSLNGLDARLKRVEMIMADHSKR